MSNTCKKNPGEFLHIQFTYKSKLYFCYSNWPINLFLDFTEPDKVNNARIYMSVGYHITYIMPHYYVFTSRDNYSKMPSITTE